MSFPFSEPGDFLDAGACELAPEEIDLDDLLNKESDLSLLPAFENTVTLFEDMEAGVEDRGAFDAGCEDEAQWVYRQAANIS